MTCLIWDPWSHTRPNISSQQDWDKMETKATSQSSYRTGVGDAAGGAATTLPAKKQRKSQDDGFVKKPSSSNTGLT